MKTKLVLTIILWGMTIGLSAQIHTIQSHIYGTVNNGGRIYVCSTDSNTSSSAIHIRNKSVNASLPNALNKAQTIFSTEMKRCGVDVAYISAEVYEGDENDFNGDELCYVVTQYATSLYGYNQNYPHISVINNDYVTYPLALVNQAYQSAYLQDTACMRIYLNPEISYYYGTDGQPTINEYDLVTVLLRALVTGSGFQSSLRVDNSGALSLGDTLANSQNYITPLDARITNGLGQSLSDIYNTDADLHTYMAGQTVFVSGNGYISTLNNDLQYDCEGLSVSSATLNTLHFEEHTNGDTYELMSPYLPQGIAIHKLTASTMKVMRSLGWMYDVAVGDIPVPSATITASSNLLLSGLTYNFSASTVGNTFVNNFRCILYADSIVTLSVNNGDNLSVMYTTLPDNREWERNPITKNIIGSVQCTANILYMDKLYSQIKTYDIEIPWKPNNPLVNIDTATIGNSLSISVRAYAAGSEKYILSYQGLQSLFTYTDTITADLLDYSIQELNPNQRYSVTVRGLNNMGAGNPYSCIVGQNNSPLTMGIRVSGNQIYYTFTCGGINVTELNIASVRILTTSGVQETTVTAGINEAIDISELTVGMHMLSVTLDDGRVFTKTFYKY